MITRLIAMWALVVLFAMNTVACLWYGFGLWPTSWRAVLLFGCIGRGAIVLGQVLIEREQAKQKD